MRYLCIFLLLFVRWAHAQSPVLWDHIQTIPTLAADSRNVLFYVSSYNSSYTRAGVHTDYDFARRDADAYLQSHPDTPTYVVLNFGSGQTCDDIPLPTVLRSNGTAATVNVVGYGSGLTTLQKRPNCAATSATLALNESGVSLVQNAVFQGFTIDANHMDAAGCNFYGIAHSTFFDIGCGDAKVGADHEAEFGNAADPILGQDSYLTLYNIKTFDLVGGGKSAMLTPQWSGGKLVGVTVANAGAKAYSQQFTRAQIFGPGMVTCASVPLLSPIVSTTSQASFSVLSTVTYGYVQGASIQNAGNCGDTADLYILIQDGVPVTTGLKFSNMVNSRLWNLEPTGASKYGEIWAPLSSNNTAIGEHPYTNQSIQIADYANGNRHLNTFFDSPGIYGAAVYGTTGSFTNAIFSWDSGSYIGSSGYLLGQKTGMTSLWQITNSQCTNTTQGFRTITSIAGTLATNARAPSRTLLQNVEVCDGTNTVAWPVTVSPM